MSGQFLSELKPFIQEAWKKSGFEQPTMIQTDAIPAIIEGKDVIAESPTGTGKTLAYLLPVLNKVDPEKRAVQAVILASSQELVMQILQEVQKWAEGSGLKGASFIGGANLKRQLEKLKKHPQVVIGTPGRTYELIKQKKLKMHEVKTVVLDEGDQLLVPEHMGTVQNIVKSTLGDRQVLLFSATLPKETEKMAQALTVEPKILKVEKDETIQSGKVEHLYIVSEQRDKIKVLEKVTRIDGIKALAFIKDIGNLTVTKEKLDFKGIEAGLLHSDLNKFDRQKAVKELRSGKSNLLFSTDVAARGLDIKGVTTVVHFDFPKDVTQYIHRSGRTGRAGAEGQVISIVTEREERELKKFARELDLLLEKRVFYKGELIAEEER
ncbi:DEAD/DEAH box helicase [Cytobacillus spongiae]|uniref:DEAD/DEAH box helicase n=1 Tax=Cytobacillus spongiae TaxID=2901381 RepID=UPI001F44D668|nr:DEAD/DEAH box helicase [Cytobacillus spongiae]UII56472.1 DEAD/DEAH box helicase [Cytobacillus spongiae]